MEVTSENFQEVVQELEEVIDDAIFIAIDGEFTGLNSGGPEPNAYDMPETYYTKLRDGSSNFLIVQMGISVFTYNRDQNSWSQRTYNFYIFPHPINNVFDSKFMCQASSISFLIQHGFDFNKVFKHGIQYLTKTAEDKFIKKQEKDREIRKNGLEDIPIPDVDRPAVEEICKKIEDFITSEEESFTIDMCNSFIRRILHQEARKRWPTQVRLEVKMEKGFPCIVVLRKGSKEDEEKFENEKLEKDQEELKKAIGFTRILRKIVESRKIVVGHNMLLDICLIISQFFESLPASYYDFKALTHVLFPCLVDTKILCQSSKIKELVSNSRLQDVLETVRKEPFTMPTIENIDGRCYDSSDKKLHEAGYDAFMTGCCFLSITNHLGALEHLQLLKTLPENFIKEFANKLIMSRLRDIPFINLNGPDARPNRDHVIHMTFPCEWTSSNFVQLFEPFGGAMISWLDDSSAYISLYKRDQVRNFWKTFPKSKQYYVTRYWEYQESLKNEGKEVKQERKRKISEDENPEPAKPEKAEAKTEFKHPNNQKEDGTWEVAAGNENSQSTQNYASVVGSTPVKTSLPIAQVTQSYNDFSTHSTHSTPTMTPTHTPTATPTMTNKTNTATKTNSAKKSSVQKLKDGFNVVRRGRKNLKAASPGTSNGSANYSDQSNRFSCLRNLDNDNIEISANYAKARDSDDSSSRGTPVTSPSSSRRRRNNLSAGAGGVSYLKRPFFILVSSSVLVLSICYFWLSVKKIISYFLFIMTAAFN